MPKDLSQSSLQGKPQFKADVVVANILAGPLRELAPTIIDFVGDKGLLALSGILEEQAESLQAIYSQWCDMAPITVQEEWVRLTGQRK